MFVANIVPIKEDMSYAREEDSELLNLFAAYGEVVKMKFIRATFGYPTVKAYVEYNNEKSAKQAVKELDGFSFRGELLSVELQEEKLAAKRQARLKETPQSKYSLRYAEKVYDEPRPARGRGGGPPRGSRGGDRYPESRPRGGGRSYPPANEPKDYWQDAEYDDEYDDYYDDCEDENYRPQQSKKPAGPGPNQKYVPKSEARAEPERVERPVRENRAKLYVGNLSFDTDEDTLYDKFYEYGDIAECKIPVGREGRSLGYGIVEFKDSRDADEAIYNLDGTEIDGRKIQVRIDRKQTQESRYGGNDTFERRPPRGGFGRR